MVDIQSDNVLKKKSFRFATVLSKSTKLRLFLSRQMHYIKQWETAFWIIPLRWQPKFPL